MYNVDGFVFEDEATAELARKEVEGVRFFKERMDLNSPEVVFKLYKKILKDQFFVTPVGIRFLVELQNALLACEQIPREEIPGIPVVSITLKTDEEAAEADTNSEMGEADAESETGTAAETAIEDTAAVGTETSKDKKSAEKAKKTAKNNNVKKKTARTDDGYKKPFYVALFFAIVFALSVVGMFVITEISGNNVNILNYRNEILDEYSTWEEQLKEKEAELQEWEEELEKREQR